MNIFSFSAHFETISITNGYGVLKETLPTGQDITLVTIEDPLILICFAKPITNQMMQDIYKHISNIRAEQPIVELLPQQVTIYSDGSYSGNLKITEYQNSMFGLVSRLPFEYALMSSDLAQ